MSTRLHTAWIINYIQKFSYFLQIMAIAKSMKGLSESITAFDSFDLVALVQILQRLQATTNSVIVLLRFALSLQVAVARSRKYSVMPVHSH